MEQEAKTHFTKHEVDLLSRFSQEANQTLKHQQEILMTAEVFRRDEQLFDLRPELSLHAPHAEETARDVETGSRKSAIPTEV